MSPMGSWGEVSRCPPPPQEARSWGHSIKDGGNTDPGSGADGGDRPFTEGLACPRQVTHSATAQLLVSRPDREAPSCSHPAHLSVCLSVGGGRSRQLPQSLLPTLEPFHILPAGNPAQRDGFGRRSWEVSYSFSGPPPLLPKRAPRQPGPS